MSLAIVCVHSGGETATPSLDKDQYIARLHPQSSSEEGDKYDTTRIKKSKEKKPSQKKQQIEEPHIKDDQ